MEKLVLNGHDLTIQDVIDVAYNGRRVEIEPAAYERLAKGRQVMSDLAEGGKAIYGFNRGVGWNKDVDVQTDIFEQTNKDLIRTHALGVAPYCTDTQVRAMMVIRLNNALIGASCASDDLVNIYRDFLNHDISPQIPARGSVGDADITTLSHFGLAFIGETNVSYQGKIVGADEAMAAEGIKPLRMQLKDGHTIILSNGQGEALTAALVKEAEELMAMSNLVYCLANEGLNGNIEAMREEVNVLRGLPGQIESARQCRHFLEGSYLHEDHPGRALQDSLTFRGGFVYTGAVRDALDYVKKILRIQINSPSDNPCILLDSEEVSVTSNFETLTLAVGVEMLNIALSHVSKAITYRMVKMTDPGFTHLTRYLAPWDGSSLGYATIQNTYTSLDIENRSLVNPSSVDFYPMEGMIEDHGSNLPLAAEKGLQMLDNLRYLIGIEALHAAQAVDLRKDQDIHLGRCTQKAYDIIRETVPFLDENRNMHVEIQNAYKIIASRKLLEAME